MKEHTREPGPLNAYVLIQDADPGSIAALRKLVDEALPPGTIGARFLFELKGSGPDQAMLVVRARDLPELGRYLAEQVRGAGSLRSITYLARSALFAWIKLIRRRRLEAVVRGRVSTDALDGLPGELSRISAYMGGASVLGDYDAVLEFGGDS